MSTYSLKKSIKSIKDIKVGIEYEFVYTDDIDGDYFSGEDVEDRPANSILNVIAFFDNDENSEIIGELQQILTNGYSQWVDESFDYFIDSNSEKVDKLITNNYYSDVSNEQKIYDNLKKKYGEDEHLIKTAMSWHNARAENNKLYFQLSNSEILDKIKSNNPYWSLNNGLQDYYDARSPIYDAMDKQISGIIDSGVDFDKKAWKAVRAWAKRNSLSEREFLNEEYNGTMSGIYSADLGLSETLMWPQQENEFNDDYKMEVILDEFNEEVSPNYEISSDGSITTNGDGEPVEIKNIGEGLPLFDALSDFKKAKDFIEYHGYVNESTGLHINMSLQGYSLEKLDYVKLVLLLGDEYLLKQFNRESNQYAMAALDRIERNTDENKKIMALETLQTKLNSLAGQIIHNGWVDKYTSINVHNNRIEFRGPGGNWVDEQEFKFLENMILRMAVVLDAALDPTKYQKEYATKLYKYIMPKGNTHDDIIKIFALLRSKELPMVAAKSWIRKLASNAGRPQVNIGERYWLFGVKDMSYIWGVGKTKSEAMEDSRTSIADFTGSDDDTDAWNRELRASAYFPTDKATYDKVKETKSTYRFHRNDVGLYVI